MFYFILTYIINKFLSTVFKKEIDFLNKVVCNVLFFTIFIIMLIIAYVISRLYVKCMRHNNIRVRMYILGAYYILDSIPLEPVLNKLCVLIE